MGCIGSKPRQTAVGPQKTDVSNVKSVENVKVPVVESPQEGIHEFADIDQHVQKAPSALKESVESLVNYVMTKTKDQRLLVRGFFVWIAENIRYDIDGLLGRQPRAPNDVTSVMKNGLSVCEGYASVMEALCRSAGIEVKKLSGFSKGFGYDADKPFTESSQTSHAWNAVRLDGKWFLLDCTWGAGHTDGHIYVKEFKEFYFLTDPAQFVNDHFPYMDNNLAESMKWQLLKKPVTLEEFNKNAQLKSHAFALGVVPESHKSGTITMTNEIQLKFRSKNKRLHYKATLWHLDGHTWREKADATLARSIGDLGVIRVHPPLTGKYRLDIFAKEGSGAGTMAQVAVYVLHCNSVRDGDFQFPIVYASIYTDQCEIVQPQNAKLPANSEINFEIKAPDLDGISVNREPLQKNGGLFSGIVRTGDKGCAYKVNAVFKTGNTTRWEAMFQYHTE
ncbi:kyphoscoliosis peptidase-like [Dreissena polymorpha]|nr:kyphoscoliosis peptidase-like [Dreissena polymorpha]